MKSSVQFRSNELASDRSQKTVTNRPHLLDVIHPSLRAVVSRLSLWANTVDLQLLLSELLFCKRQTNQLFEFCLCRFEQRNLGEKRVD